MNEHHRRPSEEGARNESYEPRSAPATPCPSMSDLPPQQRAQGSATSGPGPASKSKIPLREAAKTSNSGKVAIPRQPVNAAPRYNRRVPRACLSCRSRKSKCSGDTPVCRQCRELRVTCHYPVGWREKMKKEVDRLSEEVKDYESFLKDLRNSSESRTTEWVKTLLGKHGLKGNDIFDNSSSLLSTPQNEIDPDEPSPLSSIGSLETIDRVDEDHNRSKSTQATGFMGKSSEINWMQRVQREAEQRAHGYPGSLDSNQDDEDEKGVFSLHTLNYHLDDLEISVPGPVQLYSMPPRHLADRLFEDYLNTVHPFFPIISKPLFCAQFQTFFDGFVRSSTARPGDKWLAILNTIFAIAAKHAHLINAPWQGDENDDLVYLSRARRLSMNSEVLFSHPDLQQVQVEGLIAFYLLASDQINRAWRISVLAMRSAVTLGINLKNNSPRTPNISKEARYKVWWCLCTFENSLGIMTGRAIYTLDGGYATPLPLPFEEDQLSVDPEAVKVLNDATLRDEQISNVMASSSIRQPGARDDTSKCRSRDQSWLQNLPANTGLCFLYYCDLSVITQDIINKVYSTNSVTLPWSEIENRLDELRTRIELWHSNLPTALDFTQDDSEDAPDQLRCKISLAFHYYSARITLGRPCLCRRDARQNNSPQTFSHMMALMTLESASNILDLIPEEPDVIQLYQVCPWWCVLRYLMQAATVILLELSFGSVHLPEEEIKFVGLAKKSIRWFYAMSERSIGSRRAWQLCDSSFRKLASGMKYTTDDLPSPTPQHDRDIGELGSHFTAETGPSTATSSRDYFTSIPLEDPTPFGARLVPDEDLYTSYFNLPTPDLIWPPTGQPELAEDSYFPYDPLGGDFFRSVFPSYEDEERDQQQHQQQQQ
ncbi:hypothetical protein N7495_006847 [Penicillium taxi]|uniref:uncharacterized protein n=1 Tax=Penicillium taxi TaxID=168475 RepID=UPI0025450320|nr:uncharacterized protein N7495_006847 [Penicillium taxi]KAJ5895156.1 hypothetical protein N7495_006847 [Penicillium taxi]